AALARASAAGGKVDLHCGLRMLDDRRLDDLYDRSVRIDAGGFVVRTLGREDHLRYLCLHALGHGAWRPLWLCDLGAGLEASPGGLDWDCILSGDARRTGLVICALALAHRLLGARPEGAPAVAEARLPRWLISSTLREWGRSKIAHGNRTPMVFYMRRPAGLLAALRTRWPGPVEA